jgi:hypothetical protein
MGWGEANFPEPGTVPSPIRYGPSNPLFAQEKLALPSPCVLSF